MRYKSGIMAGFALFLSVGAHGAGLVASQPVSSPVIMDGAPPGIALLGDSFVDMVSGAPQLVQPEVTKPVEQDQPTLADTPAAAQLTQSAAPDTIQPANAVAVADAVSVATGSLAITPQVSQAVSPSAAEPVLAETVTATIETAVRPASEADVRPARRPDNLGQPQPRPVTQGAGAQDAVRGSDAGQQSGQTATAGGGANAASADPATARAAANYPGQVSRKLRRTRRVRVNARGTAMVTFTISASGGLDHVSISRSSGHAALDQAAVDHVHRSAPFPAPPADAQRRYTVPFEGR